MSDTYCIDTSSLIAAWQERYPIENFPPFWGKMGDLISKKRLVSPLKCCTKQRSAPTIFTHG